MIIKKETVRGVDIFTVSKTKKGMISPSPFLYQKLKRSDISTIITRDADVYDEEGKLMLRFRKCHLEESNVRAFYDNMIHFALMSTSNRGDAAGSTGRQKHPPKILTNIFGFFDGMSPSQKVALSKHHAGPLLRVRECRFNRDYPEKFQRALPLIRDVDRAYHELVPDKYRGQRKKANDTPFKIKGTAFTTITTNINLQTACHTDRGDDPDGFGNLVVIEDGSYSGGETCFPEYGIGVDVRTRDILMMDVHRLHGNLPVVLHSADARRFSIVCYLRNNIWKQTQGKSTAFANRHLATLRKFRPPVTQSIFNKPYTRRVVRTRRCG